MLVNYLMENFCYDDAATSPDRSAVGCSRLSVGMQVTENRAFKEVVRRPSTNSCQHVNTGDPLLIELALHCEVMQLLHL
jgi:hypothetical protein